MLGRRRTGGETKSRYFYRGGAQRERSRKPFRDSAEYKTWEGPPTTALTPHMPAGPKRCGARLGRVRSLEEREMKKKKEIAEST